MFLARRTRAPRCERCGRVTAPYSVCRSCSGLASAAASDPVPASSIEEMIAAALPEQSRAEQLIAAAFASGPPPAPERYLPPPVEAPAPPMPIAAEEVEPEEYWPGSGGYDPEDPAIPRDPDLFVGAGSGRWRRISLARPF